MPLEDEVAAAARRLTGAQVCHLAHAIFRAQEVQIEYARCRARGPCGSCPTWRSPSAACPPGAA